MYCAALTAMLPIDAMLAITLIDAENLQVALGVTSTYGPSADSRLLRRTCSSRPNDHFDALAPLEHLWERRGEEGRGGGERRE